MATTTMRTLSLVAVGAVGLGSLLPWASVITPFGTIHVNGTSGDGAITLVLAGLALVGVLMGKRWLFGVPMIIAAAVCAYDAANLARAIDDEEYVTPDIGTGLLLALVGAIGGLVLALAWRTNTAGVGRWPAGWYVDGPEYRYWDGHAWTGHTAGAPSIEREGRQGGSPLWPPPEATMPDRGVPSPRRDPRPPPPRQP
jgi:hypothetical protein